ncbi:MAG: hypothetical protein NTY77_18465 [Elusimicrobia bacterium]|nr:hypothetical protein [Elusimicrobiota bacterium]
MTWSRKLAAAGLLAAAVLPALRRLSDPDLPWHMAVGRAAVAARGLIKADTFSYTQNGRFVPYEYASDIALYAAHRLAGFWGLHLLAAAAVVLLAWLMTSRVEKGARALALAFTSLALAALAPLLILRPALLGLPCFAAALYCIERCRREEDNRWLWLMVPLQILWANVHAFAIIGAALAAAAVALVPHRRGRAEPACAAACAAAATCLSSFGPGIFLGPWRVASHNTLIREWTPSSWDLFWNFDPLLGLLVALTATALIWGRSQDGRKMPALFDLVLVLGSFLLMLLRFRMAPLFIVAAAPFAAARLWPRLKDRRWLPAAVLAAGLLAPAAVALRREVPWGIGFDPGRLPDGAVRFIAENKPQGPVWNELSLGGYLIWRLQPQVKVFIDGRTAYLYPPEFLKASWESLYRPEAFAGLAARYAFQWAVVSAQAGSYTGGPLAASPDWAMVYVEDAAAVYVNIKGPNRRLMAAGYRGLRHLTPWPLLLADDLPLPVLEHDAGLALAQAPDSARAHLWAAAVALRKGDLASARAQRDRAAALSPREPSLPLLDRFLTYPVRRTLPKS